MPQVYASVLLTISLVSSLKSGCVHENTETLKCTYFPNRISDEISRVRVVDFIGPNESMAINNSDFSGEGWNNLKYLEISNSLSYSDFNLTAETFSNLKRLNELQLHLGHLNLVADTFVGLNSVKTLDVSDCFRLSVDDLIQSLNGTNKLPNLTELTISRLNEYHPPNVIDGRVGQILQQKTLTYLDISNTEITELHFAVFKYLRHLKLVNASAATIGNTFKDNFEFSDFKNMDFDLSHIILPQRMRPPPGKSVFSNFVLKNPSVRAVGFVVFLEAKIVNASSIIPALSSIWIHNTTLIFDQPRQNLIQHVTVKNNNLKYLDVHVYSFCNKCIASRLVSIDFSSNGLEFISPSLLHFAPNIKIFDLSFNQLFKMAKNNGSLFEMLLQSLPHLQFISLSSNKLNSIPMNMFDTNAELEIIDLSTNELCQVTFTLIHLGKLKVLDLRNNLIHILDETSISHLDSIYHILRHNDSLPSLILKGNSLSCSTCDTKAFITWLLKTKMVNITSQNLTCTTEDGKETAIEDKSTLDMLQHVCYFVFYNVSICISVTFTSVLTAFAFVHACKRWHRDKVIQQLQVGHGQYEFIVLLVYHNEDNALAEYIGVNLESGMKNITNITRNLIRKSEDISPELNFISELNTVVNKTSVVISILSKNFFEDERLSFVMEGSRDTGKPIIFFFLENERAGIKRENITPGMKQLLISRTKFKLRKECEQYILQSTWEDICHTILDSAE